MKTPHLPSNNQTNQVKNSIAIFCDLQNVYQIQEFANLLLDFANNEGNIVYKSLYYSSLHQNQITAKNKLQLLDFRCIDVPDPIKNSLDQKLVFDCVKLFAPKSKLTPNIIILVLGDWDFAGLISILQAIGKKVIIFAQRNSANSRLPHLVGNENFHFIDELSYLVEKTTQVQKLIESQMNYNEAVDCLTTAIKTALSQGKGTGLGYINNLMFNLSSKYQGVSSIRASDGKTFKSFSKFVDCAVREGKIKRLNQELLLTD
ncbi:MAG TPA: NYN domain-containing protein [Nostocaceae cyanobacterium]|nr:NYN domain-containing protein [Nostocaceae cyanobacterium]